MIDYEKLAKYSAPVPRYTSYPTAPEFRDDWTRRDLSECIARSNQSSRALSLYFHLPFCRSACYFCGCNVIYTSKEELKDRYIDYLSREIAIIGDMLDVKREVRQIHFGGGTPTFFSAAQLAKIIGVIKSAFPNIAKDAEFGVEIDPRFFTIEQMDVFAQNGVNRVSFGVQDFDPSVQEAVHRVQPFEIAQNAVEIARSRGVKSVNIDLMYGLPRQNAATFERTLELTLRLAPDRLALFNYAHVPWLKKTMRKIDESAIPPSAEKLKMFQIAAKLFGESGFEMIGMDHFAKPDDELCVALKEGKLHRNFQGYTTHSECDLFGFGVTSISEGEDFYSQNVRDLSGYEKAIDGGLPPTLRGVRLTEDDRLRKRVIFSLMGSFSLDFAAIEAEFGINFERYFASDLEALARLEADELLSIANRRITVGDTGRLLIRNIVMHFDDYLRKTSPQNRRFSKSV
ncbi:MAG: oxygen-independent coproporphyrinogen III oxidase [Helicobacteraceae bacterium]|jgi:oxygen-independent coproporphyrinogen-3 oxidase|nr:oxygen-independent coproporphyrinogen III oxidase [Helicobacteraceae bacterium]